ncbi:hypothetical protein [Halapricum salinum]|uniref:Uncharacterized protein n=1 Tax=Halapricum salinum TaxID=1457250 RepID=A0A4D6HC83_9EURY|nr:hypothetical protein [Halapricum salinum]QCC51410.1 hypothetical protein DV733_09225 [Halapricum salinum]
MAEEDTRVDFTAPASLVERADRVVDVLDISRTRLLIEALEAKLEEIAADEEFRRRLSDAYYDDQVDFETVASILGREEALRMKLLKESIDHGPPEPTLTGDLPTDEEFYDGAVPEWTPDEVSDDGESRR